MGIEALYTEESVWRYQPKVKTEKGTQIDLLIDRNDSCINICEMKFSAKPFEISKAYVTELNNKLECFQEQTGTKKTLFLTMVTAYGVKNLASHPGLVQSQVTMDALFEL